MVVFLVALSVFTRIFSLSVLLYCLSVAYCLGCGADIMFLSGFSSIGVYLRICVFWCCWGYNFVYVFREIVVWL